MLSCDIARDTSVPLPLLAGDYVLIEFIDEVTKVKGDITHILYADQIKHIKSIGKWYVVGGLSP